MVFVTAETDMLSLRAAAVKPPFSATRVNTVKARNLFIFPSRSSIFPGPQIGDSPWLCEKYSGSVLTFRSYLADSPGIFGKNQFPIPTFPIQSPPNKLFPTKIPVSATAVVPGRMAAETTCVTQGRAGQERRR